jgi:hypothetical protein
MAAPKQNQFWKLRSKHGRDKLFATPDLLWDAACEYFEWCETHPLIEVEQAKSPARGFKDDEGNVHFPPNTVELPKMRAFTIQGLCLYLDCNVGYFNDFEAGLKDKTESAHKDFSVVITRIRETIYNQKFTGAASGFLNPTIIARDLGLTDKKELEHSGMQVVINRTAPNPLNEPISK